MCFEREKELQETLVDSGRPRWSGFGLERIEKEPTRQERKNSAKKFFRHSLLPPLPCSCSTCTPIIYHPTFYLRKNREVTRGKWLLRDMSTGKQRSLLQQLLRLPLHRAALKSQTRPLSPSLVATFTSFPRHRHCQPLPRQFPSPTTSPFRRHFSSPPSNTVKMSDIVHETIKGKIHSCPISRSSSLSRFEMTSPLEKTSIRDMDCLGVESDLGLTFISTPRIVLS